MTRISDVFLMHVSRRTSTWGMPVMLSLGVVAIMIVITFAMRLAGVDTLDPAVAAGFRSNQGMVGTLVGFLIVLGIQASVACFTFATALGTTRRDYVLGTGLYFLLQTVYISALLALLLAIEKSTDHWFIGAHSLDVHALGAGRWSDFLIAVPCGVLASLALGSLTGASWLRFGNRGPMIIVVVIVGIIFGAILLVIPRIDAFVAWFSMGVAGIALLVVAAIALAGTWIFLSRTSIRNA